MLWLLKPCFSFPLEFLQQCVLLWFRSFSNMPYTYHLKDVNNHNSFFGTDSHLQWISILIQCNWTFTTLGFGLVSNNAPSFGITIRVINKCYVKCKYNKCKDCCFVPHTKFSVFLASNWLGFIILPLICPIRFSLNFSGSGLLCLLVVMMNSSFMSVHHLVFHLDLN